LEFPKDHKNELIQFKYGDPASFGFSDIKIPDEGIIINKRIKSYKREHKR